MNTYRVYLKNTTQTFEVSAEAVTLDGEGALTVYADPELSQPVAQFIAGTVSGYVKL